MLINEWPMINKKGTKIIQNDINQLQIQRFRKLRTINCMIKLKQKCIATRKIAGFHTLSIKI